MDKNSLVENNLGLVRKIAHEFAGKSNCEFDDLFQEGVIGLIRASEKFDPELGFQFSTYATHWIKQKMQRYLESTMNISKKARKNRSKIYQLRTEMEERGEEANPETIAKIIGISLNDVLGVLYPDNVSIFTPLGDSDDGDCLMDVLASDDEPVDAQIQRDIEAVELRRIVSNLDDKERDVIFERYFANPDKLTTYEEISKKLGFSKQRVQQLEKRAIDKLKHSKEMLNYKKNFGM